MKKAFSILVTFFILAGCDKEENRNSGGNNNGGGTLNSCSGGQTTVTDIDGNVYNVVSIGNQCWMKENLKTTRYRNGDLIPTGLNNTQWENTTQGAWAYYNDSSQYNNPYGKLYNWYAVADARGLCPSGWHVPTDSEWNHLVKYLDPQADTTTTSSSQSQIAGGFMKDVGNWQSGTGLWFPPNSGATNSSGFTGLPGGYRDANDFYGNTGGGYWWSSSEDSNIDAWSRDLQYAAEIVSRDDFFKHIGFSIRCIKD